VERLGPAPTGARDRIIALDTLRGFAVLGILIMNVQSFSMIMAAYSNPTAYGDLAGVNLWTWALGHLFADQKFMSLFAMMFGAGIVLMTGRAEARELRPAGLHYRRMAALLLLGAAHAYLLWYGDILFWYALCGMVVFPLRRRSPKTLLIVGILSFAIPSGLLALGGASLSGLPAQDLAAFSADWSPSAQEVRAELDAYRGGWLAQMSQRVPASLEAHTIGFAAWGLWRVSGLMLIGMALFKLGILSGRRSGRAYALLFGLGLLLGLPLIAVGLFGQFSHGWDFVQGFFFTAQYNYWGSLCVALAYVGGVMACGGTRPGRLAAVGQMALTNYLLQTLICTTLFYGHGLGWFGRVERWQQLTIVLAVWALQLLLSPWWLGRFRFGPAEWLWRALAYGRWQPFRRAV